MKIAMIRYFHLLVMAMVAFCAAVQVSCTSDSDSEGGISRESGVVFYSAAAPGPWIEQAVDHEPEITITRIDDRKVLNVSVPFTRNKQKNHFVEAIVILDMKGNELKKATLKKGRGQKGAQFDFPDDYGEAVYVVIKCNKHDMWEKLVDWTE